MKLPNSTLKKLLLISIIIALITSVFLTPFISITTVIAEGYISRPPPEITLALPYLQNTKLELENLSLTLTINNKIYILQLSSLTVAMTTLVNPDNSKTTIVQITCNQVRLTSEGSIDLSLASANLTLEYLHSSTYIRITAQTITSIYQILTEVIKPLA